LQLGSARSSQPLDEPERPDHEKCEEEHPSARQESLCGLCNHDILQGVLIACSRDSSLGQRWCPAVTMSRAVRSFEAGVCTVVRRTPRIRQPPPGSSPQNWRRPSRKNPCFRGRRPWQRRHISNHGWNRTRSVNPPQWSEHLVEFASKRLRL